MECRHCVITVTSRSLCQAGGLFSCIILLLKDSLIFSGSLALGVPLVGVASMRKDLCLDNQLNKLEFKSQRSISRFLGFIKSHSLPLAPLKATHRHAHNTATGK